MAEFGTLNLEEMAGEDSRLKEQGGSASFLDQFVPMPEVKPGQTGSVAVRILPPVKGGKLFQYNRVHTLNGRKIHCPRPLVNNKWDRNVPCPICDAYSAVWKQIDKLKKAGHDEKTSPEIKALKNAANELKPVERYYYNAVVRSMVVDGKELKNVGPRILSIGKILHGSIIQAIASTDPNLKLGNVTDVKNGWDFIIRKTVTPGEEGFPKYDGSGFARQQSAAGTADELKKWQESLHDLTKLRNPKDLDYLEKELAIHRGLIPDESETFNADEFDAKWRAKAEAEMEGVASTSGKAVKVTVPAGVPAAEATKTPAPATPATAPAAAQKTETLAVEDEEFLKELEEMEG